MSTNRMTAGQLREALAGLDPNAVVVAEGLYVGPTEPLPDAAVQMEAQLAAAKAVLDLASDLQRFSDKLGDKIRVDRRAGR